MALNKVKIVAEDNSAKEMYIGGEVFTLSQRKRKRDLDLIKESIKRKNLRETRLEDNMEYIKFDKFYEDDYPYKDVMIGILWLGICGLLLNYLLFV